MHETGGAGPVGGETVSTTFQHPNCEGQPPIAVDPFDSRLGHLRVRGFSRLMVTLSNHGATPLKTRKLPQLTRQPRPVSKGAAYAVINLWAAVRSISIRLRSRRAVAMQEHDGLGVAQIAHQAAFDDPGVRSIQ